MENKSDHSSDKWEPTFSYESSFAEDIPDVKTPAMCELKYRVEG